MSLFSKYKTDKSAEDAGVWVDFDDEISVKVARANNKAAVDLRRKLEKPYRNFDRVPTSASEEMAIKIAAQAIVKDWKGVTDEDGKEIKFSPEVAEKLFAELPDFLNDIYQVALTKETFLAETVTSAKNG
jgi:hypothetical protein